VPADGSDILNITLKSPTVALAGPWQLSVPVPAR
jgi:hypothetical protein